MGQIVDIITSLHTKTERDYVGRVIETNKAECAEIAKKWGRDYWDGDRKNGYGGYNYDGRWSTVAKRMIALYGLKNSMKILDIGCGKGFLLFELKKLLPKATVTGIDVSEYALENGKDEIRDWLKLGNANSLEFSDNSFDFVYSITTLHNLYLFDLIASIKEMERVGRNKCYIAVESYRNEREKTNLLYWQLTCEAFFTPKEWEWLFQEVGYSGDFEFIYFE